MEMLDGQFQLGVMLAAKADANGGYLDLPAGQFVAFKLSRCILR